MNTLEEATNRLKLLNLLHEIKEVLGQFSAETIELLRQIDEKLEDLKYISGAAKMS